LQQQEAALVQAENKPSEAVVVDQAAALRGIVSPAQAQHLQETTAAQ
jgi:hypothetical protein